MRYVLVLIVIFSISLFSCRQQPAPQSGNQPLSGDLISNPATLSDKPQKKLPAISFESTKHDFGKVIEGDQAEYNFIFKNTGTAPLLISDVRSSCGCTTPYWPKGLIQPDSSGIIKVVYDSKNRSGEFSKDVTITTNTYPNTTVLNISGVVFNK